MGSTKQIQDFISNRDGEAYLTFKNKKAQANAN